MLMYSYLIKNEGDRSKVGALSRDSFGFAALTRVRHNLDETSLGAYSTPIRAANVVLSQDLGFVQMDVGSA